MAIALDAVSSAQGDSGGSLSWSHTCAGSDRLLCVSINQAPWADIISLTYNGNGPDAFDYQGASGAACLTILAYWIAPATGTHDVVCTYTTGTYLVGIAVSLTGVHQTTPVGTFVKATATGATATVDASSAAGELVIDSLALDSNNAPSVGAGQTQRASVDHASTALWGAVSTEPGAATVTMSWALTSCPWVIVTVPIKPSSGASAQTLEPNPTIAASAIPSPTITTSLGIEPSPAVALASVPSPTIGLSLTLEPIPVITPAVVPSPVLALTLTLEPDPVVAQAAIPIPILSSYASQTLEPTPVIVQASVPSPIATSSLTLEPAPVTALAIVPDPVLAFWYSIAPPIGQAIIDSVLRGSAFQPATPTAVAVGEVVLEGMAGEEIP